MTFLKKVQSGEPLKIPAETFNTIHKVKSADLLILPTPLWVGRRRVLSRPNQAGLVLAENRHEHTG